MRIETHLGKGAVTFNLSSVTLHKIENGIRTEGYYLIKDIYGDSKYILPIVEGANVDQKTLGYLADLRRSNDDYSIGRVLNGDKLIDTQKGVSLRNEIDTLARMNLLSSQGVELSTLSAEEAQRRINSVSDEDLAKYLEDIKSTKLTKGNTLESNLVAVQNLLTSFGIELKEAEKMTKYLRENYKINEVRDLKHLSQDELEEAFSESVCKSQVTFEDLSTNIVTFFK